MTCPVFALQSRYFDPSPNAALFYEAETRTPQNGAATAVGNSGASGGGSNVVRSAALTTSFSSVLSTQASGGGAHLQHVGDFSVMARVFVPTANVGTVSVALNWGEGDFRKHTVNASVTPPVEGAYTLLDLGQVHLTKATAGTQKWEARVIATSTVAGDTIDIDYLVIFPISEGSGQAQAIQQFETPTSFTARDEFEQAAGALTGKTMPIGGAWATEAGGSATDFNVDATSHIATRAATADASVDTGGRHAHHSNAGYAATLAQVDIMRNALATSGTLRFGIAFRVVDGSSYGFAGIDLTPSTNRLIVTKRNGGVITTIAQLVVGIAGQGALGLPLNSLYSIRLVVDTSGRFFMYYGLQGGTSLPLVLKGQDAIFATGGGLSSGKAGIYDAGVGIPAITRSFDNFLSAPPTSDTAIFAGRQLELRSDRVRRQDSGGTVWVEPSSYEGSYLTLLPSGKEGRTNRVIVKASRNDPATMADSGIDAIATQLFVTPRYLEVPE